MLRELCGLAHMVIVVVHFAARCKNLGYQQRVSTDHCTIALAMCGFAIVSCQAAVIVDNSVVSGKASWVGMVPYFLRALWWWLSCDGSRDLLPCLPCCLCVFVYIDIFLSSTVICM